MRKKRENVRQERERKEEKMRRRRGERGVERRALSNNKMKMTGWRKEWAEDEEALLAWQQQGWRVDVSCVFNTLPVFK